MHTMLLNGSMHCYASVSLNLVEVELASYTWLLLSALWEIYLDLAGRVLISVLPHYSIS